MEDGVVKSAARTIRILSVFEEVKRPQRAAEISKIMSIPLSSCVALLDTLVSEGVLAYDFKVREYFPTDRLRQMGSWLDPADFLEFSATAAARRIGGLLRCNWAIGKVRGAQVEWVSSAGGAEATIGARLPLCASSAGLAILSLRQEDEIAYAVHEHNRLASWGEVERHKVGQQILQAAKQGYALGPNGRNALAHGLCIGLRSAETGEELVLCLFMPEVRFMRSHDHILRTIRACVAVAFGNTSPMDRPLPLVA